MLAQVHSFAIDGVQTRRVTVEADVRQGLPAFNIVGLADKSVREARERVRGAIINTGYAFPDKRITVNLAPAYLRKEGPHFDLPLAIAVLAASGQVELDALEGCAFIGELSMYGSVSPVRGALAVAEGARRHGLTRLMLPASRARGGGAGGRHPRARHRVADARRRRPARRGSRRRSRRPRRGDAEPDDASTSPTSAATAA